MKDTRRFIDWPESGRHGWNLPTAQKLLYPFTVVAREGHPESATGRIPLSMHHERALKLADGMRVEPRVQNTRPLPGRVFFIFFLILNR